MLYLSHYDNSNLDVVGRGVRVEVSAGGPSGRLPVDLVDEVVGENVVVAVLGGGGIGGHRQDQH